MDDVRGITRRTALRTAAGAGVALAAASAGSLPAWARPVLAAGRLKGPGSRPNPKLPEGTDTLPQIEHIVILMMENHSFDNTSGCWAGRAASVDGCGSRRRPSTPTPTRNGKLVRGVPHAVDVPARARHPARTGTRATPSCNGGRNDGFVAASGPVAMGYWDANDIPFYYGLARRSRVATAGSARASRRRIPTAASCSRAPRAASIRTDNRRSRVPAAERHDLRPLRPARHPWRNYYTDLPAPLGHPRGPAARARRRTSSGRAALLHRRAAGKLPLFSFVDPNFEHGLGGEPAGHPGRRAFGRA